MDTPTKIAWDIETAPQPFGSLSERQRRRLGLEYKEQARRDPQESVTRLVQEAMSFHGHLCWICCVSFAWRDEDGELRSWTKGTMMPGDEGKILRLVWEFVSKSRDTIRPVKQWVTFNGKSFDSRILRTRSLANDVTITNTDLLDEYPYSYTPHCDVARQWRNDWIGLEDAADLAGVEYTSAIVGEEVATAIRMGRPDLVEQHCDMDARTTLRVYEHSARYNPELRA